MPPTTAVSFDVTPAERALHAARAAADLSTITDSQMLHIVVEAGEAIELQCYADLAPEAA